MYELYSGLVLAGRGEQVHELLGRDVFRGLWRERLCIMSGRFVFGRCSRDQRKHVCAVPGGDVFEQDRRERVHDVSKHLHVAIWKF